MRVLLKWRALLFPRTCLHSVKVLREGFKRRSFFRGGARLELVLQHTCSLAKSQLLLRLVSAMTLAHVLTLVLQLLRAQVLCGSFWAGGLAGVIHLLAPLILRRILKLRLLICGVFQSRPLAQLQRVWRQTEHVPCGQLLCTGQVVLLPTGLRRLPLAILC